MNTKNKRFHEMHTQNSKIILAPVNSPTEKNGPKRERENLKLYHRSSLEAMVNFGRWFDRQGAVPLSPSLRPTNNITRQAQTCLPHIFTFSNTKPSN